MRTRGRDKYNIEIPLISDSVCWGAQEAEYFWVAAQMKKYDDHTYSKTLLIETRSYFGEDSAA